MKKSIFFLYGIISYIVFFIAFLYSIGFVGSLLVPKSINTGMESNFTESIIINLLLLSIFAIQHTIMARPAFKKWWTTIINPAVERSTFVILTSLILLLIFLAMETHDRNDLGSTKRNLHLGNQHYLLGWMAYCTLVYFYDQSFSSFWFGSSVHQFKE